MAVDRAVLQSFFLIIILIKWKYQPKECSGPSFHNLENLLETFVHLKNAENIKNAKTQKRQKNEAKKWSKKMQKNIIAGVVVVVVVVDLLDLVLLLQIFFHAKSGGCSFKIDWVMANLVQLKFWQTLTDTLVSPLYSSEIHFRIWSIFSLFWRPSMQKGQ